MKKLLLPWFVGGLAGLSAFAQEPVPVPATPPSQPAEPPADEAGKATSAAIERWIADLGSDNYRSRLQAERALREQGEAAVAALQRAAADSADREVQWRARRLLRQIESGADGGLQPRGERGSPRDAGEPLRARIFRPQGPWTDDIRSQFDQIFERMERDFGLDIPRMRFFQDDFFQDLQQQMQGLPGLRQGMSMQIGPDGKVRVEIERQNAQGETEKEVYEAPDLETLRQQHPELRLPLGAGGGLQWFFGDRQGGNLGMPRLQDRFGQPPFGGRLLPRVWGPDTGAAPVPDDGPRLGIFVRPEIPLELRRYLELTDGQGLMVEAVQDGSLAQQLGLREGDIVLRLGDHAIGSADDVQRALGKLSPGAEFTLRYLRKGAERSAVAKLPAAAAPTEPRGAAGEPEPGPRRLQRRDR